MRCRVGMLDRGMDFRDVGVFIDQVMRDAHGVEDRLDDAHRPRRPVGGACRAGRTANDGDGECGGKTAHDKTTHGVLMRLNDAGFAARPQAAANITRQVRCGDLRFPLSYQHRCFAASALIGDRAWTRIC